MRILACFLLTWTFRMGLAADPNEKKHQEARAAVVPRSAGKPVAPTPLRVSGAPPSSKSPGLVGVAAAPKSEPAPATTPEPPRPLDSKPLLPARTPNKIAIVQGNSIRPSVKAPVPAIDDLANLRSAAEPRPTARRAENETALP